jgi:hypothetical protein
MTGRRLRRCNFSIKLMRPEINGLRPQLSMRSLHDTHQENPMAGPLFVYEPVAPCLTKPRELRKSLDSLTGKVIGFIDNSKPNFNLLVEALSQILIEKHGVKSIVKRRKKSASQGAPAAVLDELAAQVDAVITGSGD